MLCVRRQWILSWGIGVGEASEPAAGDRECAPRAVELINLREMVITVMKQPPTLSAGESGVELGGCIPARSYL